MHLSVIIPTFNRAEVLRRLLNLLSVQTLPKSEFEVIVIDDGSQDDTPRLLAEFAESGQLQLRFESQKNAGQGPARNRGLELARGRLVLFLGDDMLPLPSCLLEHVRFHVLHPEPAAACLGFVRWHPDLRPSRFMRWLETSGVQFRFHDLARGELTDFFRFYTANISLKREFLGAERFDPRFRGWGWEDTELGYRLAKKGLRLIYWPEAVTEHLHQISDEDLERRQFSSGRNAVLFQRLHPAAPVLPSSAKRLAQAVAARLLFFTFWGRAKRAFLAGVAAGESEFAHSQP